MHRKQP